MPMNWSVVSMKAYLLRKLYPANATNSSHGGRRQSTLSCRYWADGKTQVPLLVTVVIMRGG